MPLLFLQTRESLKKVLKYFKRNWDWGGCLKSDNALLFLIYVLSSFNLLYHWRKKVILLKEMEKVFWWHRSLFVKNFSYNNEEIKEKDEIICFSLEPFHYFHSTICDHFKLNRKPPHKINKCRVLIPPYFAYCVS